MKSQDIYLNPQEVYFHPEYTGMPIEEHKRLAAHIAENKQITPVYVRDDNGMFVVYSGNRRLDAIRLLQVGFTYKGNRYHDPKVKLHAMIFETNDNTANALFESISNPEKVNMPSQFGPVVPHLPQAESHYKWMRSYEIDGKRRLLAIRDVPGYVGDLFFASPIDADSALDENDLRDKAVQENWVLTVVSYEPVGLIELRQYSPQPVANLDLGSCKETQCEFHGTPEQCEQYATDEDYVWMAVDEPNQYPCGGFYYRVSDTMEVHYLIPVPRLAF